MNLFLPVATEILVKREQAFFNSALAAVASLVDAKAAKNYTDSLNSVLKLVEKEQLETRGFSKEDIADLEMERFARQLMNMKGLRKR